MADFGAIHFQFSTHFFRCRKFDLPINPPFRFSPCYLLADFSELIFNRSTVIFYFFVRGQKLFLLKINDLENIFKKVAQEFVYIIYTMYICTINLKQEQNDNSKINTRRTTLCSF